MPENSAASMEDLGPVFIPIVLAMEPGDHEVLLEDWCRQQAVGAGHPFSSLLDELKQSCTVAHCG